MTWFLAALVVVILAVAAVVASGRWGAMPELVDDRPSRPLPPGEIDAEALRGVQFSVVTRGYSMQQVDQLLDRLIGQFEAERVVGDELRQDPDGTPLVGPMGNLPQSAE
ncbi:DivIVA domain-containing protein [Luteococcus sp. H138]|uniref:DivIVA domain-containing protein n=1 Tax=unclassified Luteococcus TaxID=2639923 RepID=UPI00313A9428